MPYIIQNFFILVAPALFAASIYMTLGRIMRAVKGEDLSLVKVGRLTKTFMTGDVISFMIQGGSAGLMFQSSTTKIGEDMVVAGLFIQVIMFGLFAITAMLFQVCGEEEEEEGFLSMTSADMNCATTVSTPKVPYNRIS